ncbi:hypothetical protein COLO4_35839 [Corchorus olitorius]|uniref:Uncharacterized protein n=1 Tax=Corchorus olitorius TaxID=93759 RepID=A0A1R3GCZ0_9ROSI|nr:hypothetical protein COLO4_35839 [Corchorus olitorius]
MEMELPVMEQAFSDLEMELQKEDRQKPVWQLIKTRSWKCDQLSPWVFTVGASTLDREFSSYVELGNNMSLKEFVKLSAASGVMLWLENLYYKVLIFMTGNLENAKITVDALSIWSRLVANPFKKEVEELQMELRKYLNCSQAATASVAYTPSQDHEQYRQADKYSLVETISACSDSGDETASFSQKDDIENIACSFPEINVWVGEHVERAAKVCIDKEERILLLQRSLEDAQRMIVEMEMKLSSLKGAAIALNENQDCLRHSCFAKESRFWILRSKPKISKKGLIQSLIVGMSLGKIYRSSSLKLKHEQGEE